MLNSLQSIEAGHRAIPSQSKIEARHRIQYRAHRLVGVHTFARATLAFNMASSDSATHFLNDKRIIISGAGISGLTFAYSLHKLWPSASSSSPPPLTLYERDPCTVPPNREGYSLSLRSDRPTAGIQTLQKMGLLDRMIEVSITGLGGKDEEGKGGFCIWDKDFGLVMKVKSKTPENCPIAGMRIARASLRRTLVEAVETLPGVTIKWGEAIIGVASSSSGTIEAETDKGEKLECDLLIAADGSSSKIRTILRPDDALCFAGPTCITGTVPIVGHHPSDRDDEFGTSISGAGRALFIAPVDHENMIWNLSWPVDKPPLLRRQPMSTQDAQALLDEAKTQGAAMYTEKFSKMLQNTDLKTISSFNAMDKQPFPHAGRYITASDCEGLDGNVLFLGDANHAVSPFAGNGANLALMDGWDLAESLIRSSALEEAVRKFDKLAVGRAKKVIFLSHFTIRVMHSSGWMLWFWMWFLRVVRWLFFRGGS